MAIPFSPLARTSIVLFGAYASLTGSGVTLAGTVASTSAQPHNVILFVPDGLRAIMVNLQNAPTMAALAQQGVVFANSHSLFPTFTTPNASAFATGHYLGDTGDFSNVLYSGFPVKSASDVLTPFLEDNSVLAEMDSHFAGNYLHEQTIMDAAQHAGYSTAAIGKLGPTLIADHTNRTGFPTIIVDDMTAPDVSPERIPLSKEMRAALTQAGLDDKTPNRGDNRNSGTLVSNRLQQDYFVKVATESVLPVFKMRRKPFFMVFWSRDPDGTQHNQGDSPDKLTPGINGPTSLDGIKDADDDLAKLIQKLKDLGLDRTTDIIVSADHGFSTISKESQTSTASQTDDAGHTELSSGFVAVDIAHELGLPLFDPDHGTIGKDPTKPDVVVAENGGSDLIYFTGTDKSIVSKVINLLLKEDYTSGIFVADSLGKFPGTLPLSAINLEGAAITPHPAIIVNFKSFVSNTAAGEDPLKWAALVADTSLLQGQGQHGSFSRADTKNFMAATGPDFKQGFTDPAPVSNADIGQTVAHLLHLHLSAKGTLVGRTIQEAFPNQNVPTFSSKTLVSDPAANGLTTVLNYQELGGIKYFDAAGFPGRTVGLVAPESGK